MQLYMSHVFYTYMHAYLITPTTSHIKQYILHRYTYTLQLYLYKYRTCIPTCMYIPVTVWSLPSYLYTYHTHSYLASYFNIPYKAKVLRGTFEVVHSTTNVFLKIYGCVNWQYKYTSMLPWRLSSLTATIFSLESFALSTTPYLVYTHRCTSCDYTDN